MIYEIFHVDDWGRPMDSITLVNAKSKEGAREIAAKRLKSPDIVRTGFYTAVLVSREEIIARIRNHKLAIRKLRRVL